MSRKKIDFNSENPNKDFWSSKLIYKVEKTERLDYEYLVHQTNIKSKRILDTACGNGDFLDFANDAIRFGIDFSEIQVRAAKSRNNGLYCVADVKNIPFKNNVFDVVFSSHLIEHLYEHELIQYFKNAFFTLKQNGKFVCHTCPNTLYRYGVYRFYTRWVRMVLYRIANLFLTKKMAVPSLRDFTPESKVSKLHVNEKSPYSLRNSLKNAGFTNLKVWCYGEPFKFKFLMLPIYIVELLYPLPKIFPTFFTNHVWAVAEKNGTCESIQTNIL